MRRRNETPTEVCRFTIQAVDHRWTSRDSLAKRGEKLNLNSSELFLVTQVRRYLKCSRDFLNIGVDYGGDGGDMPPPTI